MSLPGLSNVAGVVAAITYRFLDPRSKKERLLDEKQKILGLPLTPRNVERLADVDRKLLSVQREIDRRAG